MQKFLCGMAGAALAVLGVGAAHAQDSVKIGMVNEYSGQFADTGAQIDHGVELYIMQHGPTVGGKKIEIIRKDTGGIAPDLAKRLSQEVIVRDHADILGGFSLTPNALASADVSAQAKKFMVVMNAATSVITEKSPYIARTSSTTPQLNYTLGQWAAKNGLKKIYTMVSNYGPGIDA
jgi:branched-chain amino acid transport system substrate-binding protein